MKLQFRTDAYEDAQVVRRRVFMEEQGFQQEFGPEDEAPEMIHVTAYDEEGALLGCARVFPSSLEPGLETKDGRWVFGRLAVLPEKRKGGIGRALLEEAERVAQEAGATEIHLHAQCEVQPFYEKSGYKAYGPIEYDEHVEHQWMMRSLR